MSRDFAIDPGARCADRQASLLDTLGRMRDPQLRLTWIMDRARHRPGLELERRTPDRLIPGCAVRVWFDARMEGGLCRLGCDSDAGILKAVAGLMCEIYDGRPPAELVAVEPEFLTASGVWRQFSENRRRTILRIRERIREFGAGGVSHDGPDSPDSR